MLALHDMAVQQRWSPGFAQRMSIDDGLDKLFDVSKHYAELLLDLRQMTTTTGSVGKRIPQGIAARSLASVGHCLACTKR